MKLYALDDMEEILVLLWRVEWERHKVLFVKGEPYHDKAVRKIRRMHRRIEKLGGDVNAKIVVKTEVTADAAHKETGSTED